MFVVGGVVDAGRQQHHGRFAGGGVRRDRCQRFQKHVRIVLDRRDPMPREQFRKQPQHDLAVLQHVGDAGRRAGIVLEHIEGVGIDAHEVDARDRYIKTVRHLLPVHLRPERGVAEHHVVRDHPGAQDLARAVDVADQHVERLDPLGQAALDLLPFGGGKDARDHVERDQPLLGLGLAIDREGDADAAEDQLGLAPPVVERILGLFVQPAEKLVIGEADPARTDIHLVKGRRHRSPASLCRSRSQTSFCAEAVVSQARISAFVPAALPLF